MAMAMAMAMRDVEMSSDEKKKKNDIEMLRKKLKEWGFGPYHYQIFNKEESTDWRNPRIPIEFLARSSLEIYNELCKQYRSFDFSIEPTIVGNVKHCSYSELDGIVNFKNAKVVRQTMSGRLFHGVVVEGSEERPVIVKTWDFLLPLRDDPFQCVDKFCDEIELFTDEKVYMHPNLMKLYRYCCDTRLAVVYDEGFTGELLYDVLLSDDFGWAERMKVATQLADLYSCFHESKAALGLVTARYIMIDKEFNIKVFDFGYATNGLSVDRSFLKHAIAPEILKGERTMKSDVYFFGVLLVELIARRQFDFTHGIFCVETFIKNGASSGTKLLVHECFTEVCDSTASDITRLVIDCTDIDPDKRPAMKDVLDTLNAMGMRGEKRKRDENEAEQKKRYPLGLAASEF